jgi:hypothetical protein
MIFRMALYSSCSQHWIAYLFSTSELAVVVVAK